MTPPVLLRLRVFAGTDAILLFKPFPIIFRRLPRHTQRKLFGSSLAKLITDSFLAPQIR